MLPLKNRMHLEKITSKCFFRTSSLDNLNGIIDIISYGYGLRVDKDTKR